jgi:DNA-directed RNA polymerase II subunit RPB2
MFVDIRVEIIQHSPAPDFSTDTPTLSASVEQDEEQSSSTSSSTFTSVPVPAPVPAATQTTTHTAEHTRMQSTTETNVFEKILIGKVPIMVKSHLCYLSQVQTKQDMIALGEDPDDMGAYFIMPKGCKTVIAQERQAENMLCFYRQVKFSHVVEIKSVNTTKFLPAKALSVKLTARSDAIGQRIYVTSTQFKQDIPLFVLFRALGIESDKRILTFIFGKLQTAEYRRFFHLLDSSLKEAASLGITTQERAIEYLARIVVILSHPKKVILTDADRHQLVFHLLAQELLPHIQGEVFPASPSNTSFPPHSFPPPPPQSSSPTNHHYEHGYYAITKKAYYLAYMVHQLLLFYAGYQVESDRDSYTFKRVNSTGVLLASLTRQHVTKFTKDAQQAILKELDGGNWKFRGSMMSIFSGKLNHIFKSSTLDAGLMYSLNTGKWGMKNYLSKSGVAQVLNRHNASSILSHLRRSNTPIDKTNKLILPRELHLSAWGRMCPCETPEGGAIGSVRNLALVTEFTMYIPESFIRELLTSSLPTTTITKTTNQRQYNQQPLSSLFVKDIIPFPTPPFLFDPSNFVNHVKIVVNGDIVGFTLHPRRVFDTLISLRRSGIIHPHVSIYYQNVCILIRLLRFMRQLPRGGMS